MKCIFNFDGTNIDYINAQRNVLKQEKFNLKNENDENQLSLSYIIDKISNFSIISIQQTNKQLLINYPKLAKCPSDLILKELYLVNNNKTDIDSSTLFNCQNDVDCPGMQMCCGFSMPKVNNAEIRFCVYAQSTTRKSN